MPKRKQIKHTHKDNPRGRLKRYALLHTGLLFAASLFLLLSFFYLYLPAITKHGESITVPNLKGMTLEEARSFLLNRDLSFRVAHLIPNSL